MVIERAFVAVAPLESQTSMVNGYVAAAVGVPLITLELAPEPNDKPGGSEPVTTAHVG